jgi:hypothetical protein
MARILDFTNEQTGKEYIVILDDANKDNPDDWARPGFICYAIVNVKDDGDFYKLPQECELSKD